MATIYAIEYSEELVCPLCLDTWKSPQEVQPCGHIFCDECFPKNASTCPICRGNVEGLKAPHRTLVALALAVKVRCERCGWEGSRESSLHHKCDKKSIAARPTASTIKPPAPSNEPAHSPAPYDFGEGHSLYEMLTSINGGSDEFGPAQPWARYGMTEEEYLQAVSLFDFFTEGQSEELQRPQVTRLMRWLNYAHTPQEIAAIFADMDTDGDGTLDKEEYLTWLSRHKPDPQSLYGLNQVEYNQVMMLFHMFDIDQDGWLHKADICDLLLNTKKVKTVQEAEQCYREMDRDGNGLIDLKEFLLYSAKEARKEREKTSSARNSTTNVGGPSWADAMGVPQRSSRAAPPPTTQQNSSRVNYFDLEL